MSPGQTLRAFVTARLAAAAEDIFELFERTILEYEEELCRCKKKRRQEEAQDEERRQEEAHDVQTASQTFGPDFTHETAETPQVKEEPEEERLKEEEEEQQDNDPEYSVAHVKTETRISSETTRQTEAFTHTDDEEDWREMDTEADVDHYNQAQRATSSGLCPKYKSAVEIGGDVGSSSDTDDDDDDNDSEMTYPEMTENPEDLTGTAQGDDVRQFQSRFLAKEKAHHCPSCDKTHDSQLLSRNSQLLSRDSQLLSRDSQLLSRDSQLLSRDSQLLSRDSQLLSRDSQLLSRDSQLLTKLITVSHNFWLLSRGSQRLSHASHRKLPALVTARLAAAAEDIFELFERTILEYEEELCRCKEKRRQEEAHDVSQMFGLNQETLCTPQTPQVKEEQEEPRLKQEEELPQVLFPKCHVKLEYIRIDPQIQSVDEEDPKPETVGELEPEAEGDPEPPHTDTTEDRSVPVSAQERSINTAHSSEEKPRKHQCDICQKRFVRKDCLRMHIRTHSKEKPHRCPICSKAFTLRSTLTGFVTSYCLTRHMGSHARKQLNALRKHLQMASLSPGPGPGLNPQTPQVKEEPEEQILNQEEDQLPVCLSKIVAVRVKTEESSSDYDEEEEQRSSAAQSSGVQRADPDLNQETPCTPCTPKVKEELEGQRLKQEEEEQKKPESRVVIVKTEESPVSENSDFTSDNDDDWRAPFSCSVPPMETEATRNDGKRFQCSFWLSND
uniref:C2H2-type domain-containing protein n=1 Tax=Knipowitschia caucasica TaxID=637954 RepID=A0AAV2M596_KNICA